MEYDDERNPANAASGSQDEDAGPERRPSLERILPELLRKGLERGIEAGLNTLSRTDDAVRGVMADAKLPRELATYLLSQVDDTKKAILRVVAKEVRDVLQATDLKRELQNALTNMAIEVRTEIRFRPSEDGQAKADVKSQASVKKSTAP